jgi:hypothetical protein
MRISHDSQSIVTSRRVTITVGTVVAAIVCQEVYQADDGSPAIGVSIDRNHAPFLKVWFEDGQIQKQFDRRLLVEQFELLGGKTLERVKLEQFAAAAYMTVFANHGVTQGQSSLTEEEWRSIVTAALPNYDDMSDAAWQAMKSVRAREIANALGLSPASVKKEDVLFAIAEHRRQYEAVNTECTEITRHINVVVDICETADREPEFAMFDLSNKQQAKPLPASIQTHIPVIATANRRGWTGYLYDETVVAGSKSLYSLASAGVNVTDAQLAHETMKTRCWFANQQVSSLRAEVEKIQNKLDDLEAKRAQLAASIQASRPIALPSSPGTVMVMGEDIPFFASPNAPAAIDNYSLEFWSASMRVGQGADNVKFNAVDFMNAVLGDPVVSLIGAPGTGKTTICRQSAHVMGIPCTVVQFTRDKPIEQLIGVDKIRGGQQVFVDGEITVAMRAAEASPDIPHLIVFDEFDHAPSEVQSDFHGVVEGRDYTLPNGEVIKNCGNLRFVLTRNTSGHGDVSGRHASANISDSAFNSRIKSTFIVDYMDPTHEQVLLTTYGLDVQEAEQVVAFANATRRSVESVDSGESFDGMSEPVCLRHLIGYASTRARGVGKKKALAQCIIAALPQADRRVANELVVSHISLD